MGTGGDQHRPAASAWGKHRGMQKLGGGFYLDSHPSPGVVSGIIVTTSWSSDLHSVILYLAARVIFLKYKFGFFHPFP